MHSADQVLVNTSIRRSEIPSDTARTACASNESSRSNYPNPLPSGNWMEFIQPSTMEDEAHQLNRFRLPSTTAKISMIPMEPASLVMDELLRGIKRRAEHLASHGIRRRSS